MGIFSRVGITFDSGLLKRFGRSIGRRNCTNRSEAFRGLIRDRLATEQTVALVGAVPAKSLERCCKLKHENSHHR
jgi:metal-responsive CopG/Arc/MetJ family transcriptional regulator